MQDDTFRYCWISWQVKFNASENFLWSEEFDLVLRIPPALVHIQPVSYLSPSCLLFLKYKKILCQDPSFLDRLQIINPPSLVACGHPSLAVFWRVHRPDINLSLATVANFPQNNVMFTARSKPYHLFSPQNEDGRFVKKQFTPRQCR